MKKFDITSDLQCEKTLEINYITGYGKGKMILNLDEILPCSAHDFKIIMQTIEKVTCPDRNGVGMYDVVDKLNTYIVTVINTCKSCRDKLDKDVDKRWIAEINGIMKKYISLNGMLADEFDIEKVSDTDAEIKLKKATVYGLVFDNEGKMEAQEFSGWIFTKNGVVFDVYNSGKKGKPFYEILLHGTGARVAWSQKRREIPLAINDNVMKFIVENPDKIADIKKEYNAAMLEAGFIEPEIQAAEPVAEPITETAENVVESTKAETPDENVTDTANETITAEPAAVGTSDWIEQMKKELMEEIKPLLDDITDFVANYTAELDRKIKAETLDNKPNKPDIATIRRVYYVMFASDRHAADNTQAYNTPVIRASVCYGYTTRIMPHSYIMPVYNRYPASAAGHWAYDRGKGHYIRGSPANIFSVYTTQSR